MIPKIIDLFSGCGGLSLGFEKAGFNFAAGIEMVASAHSTVSYNLSLRYGNSPVHICKDITETDAASLIQCSGDEGVIVIGGPPCQAYSLAGRGKLRSLGKGRDHKKDSRGYLYQDFLRFVYTLQAKAVIMENVPEAISFGKINVPETVCSDLENHGYTAYWTVLNSADYGVPQIRERLFVIAIKSELNKTIDLPIPTHVDILGYFFSSRAGNERLLKYAHYKEPRKNCSSKAWVNVGEALSDLPSLLKSPDEKYQNPDLSIALPYKTEISNEYQKIMRKWYGNPKDYVTGNAYRNNTRDFKIFAGMNEGDNYVAAHDIAEQLFFKQVRILGYSPEDENYKKLYKKMVPCYDTSKFIDKWKRLRCDRPSHTIVAHLSVDTYSHIHPWEPRGISVREAARLQSFPDDFLFNCSMGDAFKQIGNAVPPLLSYAIASSVYDCFNEKKKHEIKS